jgi:hypothetical protein
MKRKIRKVLREHYGEFQTKLEKDYESKIIENLQLESNRWEWATYNQLILELKNNIKDNLRLKELLYRITDKENPNDVCMDIISKINIHSPELDRLADKIRNFE